MDVDSSAGVSTSNKQTRQLPNFDIASTLTARDHNKSTPATKTVTAAKTEGVVKAEATPTTDVFAAYRREKAKLDAFKTELGNESARLEADKQKFKEQAKRLSDYAINVRKMEKEIVEERERLDQESARLKELRQQQDRDRNAEMDQVYKQRLQSLELLDTTSKQKEKEIQAQAEQLKKEAAALKAMEDCLCEREAANKASEEQLSQAKQGLEEKLETLVAKEDFLKEQQELHAQRAIENTASLQQRADQLEAQKSEIDFMAFKVVDTFGTKKRKVLLEPNRSGHATVLQLDKKPAPKPLFDPSLWDSHQQSDSMDANELFFDAKSTSTPQNIDGNDSQDAKND